MWILRTTGPAAPKTFRLPPGHARTIGRATGADFIVDAPLASRVHCRITATDAGDLTLTDLGSTNGTYVNGERVGTATLKEGDRVMVGRAELVVERATSGA